jgi:hypothetical protein
MAGPAAVLREWRDLAMRVQQLRLGHSRLVETGTERRSPAQAALRRADGLYCGVAHELRLRHCFNLWRKQALFEQTVRVMQWLSDGRLSPIISAQARTFRPAFVKRTALKLWHDLAANVCTHLHPPLKGL